MRTREGAVGITRRRERPRDDGGGRNEARETTPKEVRQRALTLCGAGGGDEVLPRVMGVHLNYSVSLYRIGVLGFWGIASAATALESTKSALR